MFPANLPKRPLAAALLSLSLTGSEASVATISTPKGGLSARVDEASGVYAVVSTEPAWTFAGRLEGGVTNLVGNRGRDTTGDYQQLTFAWSDNRTPMTGLIRLYDGLPVALFSSTSGVPLEAPPAPFPSFTNFPANLHLFSHGLKEFAPPQFAPNELCTPWLLFDEQANACVISPASHFMVATMSGDGRQTVASGLNPKLRNLPAGFTQQTLLAFGKGINATWDTWGRSLLNLQGAKRPASDADAVLKYLGYWTDNGASYYYNYDTDKGYAGTLQALVEHYQKAEIPIRYLQLDSWWYSKSFTGADGKVSKIKAPKLPAGEWNRYGGTLEYKAHKFVFPDGLAAFQKSIGIPLVTHSRWIDPASPYHERYKMSGVAVVDPKWWDEIAAYLKSCGVATYEQDWLDRIYTYSPEFSSDPGTGEAFLDNMARACRENGITLQYCMPFACYFLQGCRYENLTTIRTCTDRFGPRRWNDFIYTSRLAASLGIWPWADVYNSTELNNVLLSTLSAGPVGVGDAIGTETTTNLVKAVRADGVIVKPDVPITPTDRTYIADAEQVPAPLVASTHTDHGDRRTGYVFAFNRPKASSGEVRFTAAELGLSGPVYVHDYFAGSGSRLEPDACFSAGLTKSNTAFYIVAPVGKSGLALIGDAGKFVSTGKQRLASLQEQPGKLTLDVLFAESEKAVVLHGYAAAAPRATARSGQAGPVHYDAATQHFTVEVRPDPSAPADKSTGDPVRRTTVVLEARSK